MAPSEIAQLLHRDKSTMTRLLVQRTERKKDGRPKLLDSAKVDELVARLDHLIMGIRASCHRSVTPVWVSP